MKSGDLLAVYGLLRAGEVGFERFGLARAFEHVGPCIIPGTLFDLGDYPGLVAGEGRVIGELFRVTDMAVMPQLDKYEDYDAADEASSRYLRRQVALLEPDVTAWVYLWNRSVEGCKPIANGDWLAR